MARPARFLLRLALLGGAFAAASLAAVAWLDRVPARDLLPADAPFVVEAAGAAEIVGRIEGTRFAAALERSATAAWLAQGDAVAALDRVRAELKRVTGLALGRRAVLDVVGSEAALAWYPSAKPGGEATWVGACRLSLRAYAAAGALRAAERLGFGGGVTRERTGDRDVYVVPGGDGGGVRLLLVRRLLVVGNDRALVVAAARCADEAAAPVTADPAWAAVRRRLPPRGALVAWARAAAVPGSDRPVPAGLLVTDGNPVEVHAFAAGAPAPGAAAAGPGIPALALLKGDPLLFHASRGAPPAALLDLLRSRERAAAGPGARPPALRPGAGYAVVVTEAGGGQSLIPLPRGLVAVGMEDAARAREALPRLYPPGARSAAVAGTTALATRESLPLAGEIELWGAAVGPSLLFATGTDLIAAAGSAGPAAAGPDPGWRVGSVSSLAMDKALPLLRRAAPPLSGLVAARWPDAPDLARDVELLGAVRSVRVTAGVDADGVRAIATVPVRDLP